MRLRKMKCEDQIVQHLYLLDHNGFGATELRIFKPKPFVAYADSAEDVVRLCREMYGKASGIYIGVQPRPLHLFEKDPNRWIRAVSKLQSNCAKDDHIEWIVVIFFDIDVDSQARREGFPASEEELQLTLSTARLIARQEGFALNSTICCSDNGHYVLTPIIPIPV